jgi:hypothetical protein
VPSSLQTGRKKKGNITKKEKFVFLSFVRRVRLYLSIYPPSARIYSNSLFRHYFSSFAALAISRDPSQENRQGALRVQQHTHHPKWKDHTLQQLSVESLLYLFAIELRYHCKARRTRLPRPVPKY